MLLCHDSKNSNKPVILICCDQKHGKINPEKDAPLYDKELAKYYSKDLSILEENKEEISKLIVLNESFFILSKSSNLYGWGWNEHGNLGTGNTVDLDEVTLIKKGVVDVFANGAYSMLKCING